MQDISEPTVVGFVNRVIRPYCDRRVGMKQVEDTELSTWFATISGLLSGHADSDIILDGSAADGRTPITKADMVNVITQMLADQTAVDLPGVFDVLNKPKVNVVMP